MSSQQFNEGDRVRVTVWDVRAWTGTVIQVGVDGCRVQRDGCDYTNTVSKGSMRLLDAVTRLGELVDVE
ncbi:MAG TPA: hypothetical protein VMW52_01405 [Phycisphaerae bacterium]|nr:hypothetical protein [Phycisphaerae bacterium]